jgi:hypothetical protein
MPADDELAGISEPSPPSGEPYAPALLEEQRLANELAREQLEQLKQDRDQRKLYAERILWIVVVWIISLFALLLLEGFRWYGWRGLPSNVLITLAATTTGAVIGLLIAVLRYLFPSHAKEPRTREPKS